MISRFMEQEPLTSHSRAIQLTGTRTVTSRTRALTHLCCSQDVPGQLQRGHPGPFTRIIPVVLAEHGRCEYTYDMVSVIGRIISKVFQVEPFNPHPLFAGMSQD